VREAAFDEIKKANTLRHEVTDMIRRAIVTGKLLPGDHLRETTIAGQMGVSRSPVREAFRLLEQEGLVESVPNRGCYVKDFDVSDVVEIFVLRAALESLACELLLNHGGLQDTDFARLQTWVDEQQEAVSAGDFDTLTELDVKFHEFICERCGSRRLLRMWEGLRAQCEVLFHKRFRILHDHVPPTVVADHLAILDALRDQDVQVCARLHREINDRVMRETIELLGSAEEGERLRDDNQMRPTLAALVANADSR
jgi:DNA-binding GntR family transcriptional regulator